MIVLNPNPTFDAPVQLTLPGTTEQEEAVFTFRTLSRKRMQSMLILIRAIKRSRAVWLWEFLKMAWRVKRWPSMVEMLDEIIASWDGFDEPYSKKALRTLLQESPGAIDAIFLAHMNNQEAARRKNLPAPPGPITGSAP